ncbi:MAG: porin [Thiotrichales bacterium]|nr:porin [Thiotrichales bacterium]
MERKLIAAAVSSALVLPMTAQAVEFSVSGHINRAVISVDGGGANDKPDAHDGDVQHVDSNASQTRFRFTGSEELESGMTAGVQLEYGLATNVRQANVYLSTAGGKITVGHSSVATDGMAHARLGGPSWLGGVTNWCSYASSGPACPSNDGGRMPVLRYDTPAIGPASIAVSTGNDDYFDLTLKIAGSMGDAGYDFRIGHIAEYEADVAEVAATNQTVRGEDLAKVLLMDEGAPEDLDSTQNITDAIMNHQTLNEGVKLTPFGTAPTDRASFDAALYNKYTAGSPAGTKDVGDITTMSGAVSFGQGTSVAAAWSQQETGAQVEYTYMELDHSYGDGSIGVYYKAGEYGATDGMMMKGTEGTLWGIGVGHSLGGGAHAYAGYRQISEDGMKDIDLLLAGMRVTFN